MVGQKFGHMTILEELPRRYSHRWVLCQCDCGKKKPARLIDLQRGKTVGCGCWKRQPRKTQKGCCPNSAESAQVIDSQGKTVLPMQPRKDHE